MTRDEIYSAWSPPHSIWQPWGKPVLFTQVSGLADDPVASEPALPIALPPFNAKTAIVVDLPGEQSVAIGILLAAIGYRPVPLFNACPAPAGAPSVVNVLPTIAALAARASLLISLRLPDDAPPAFLLDSRRRVGGASVRPGMFDNRSISLPTDFPSANLLLARGVVSGVLISIDDVIETDLSHTLLRWQQAGVAITNSATPPQQLTIRRPSRFRWLLHNALAMLGLRRHPLGGFGGRLPLGGSVG